MKSQSSMEFIAIFMILLAALVVISFISYTQLQAIRQYQTDLEVEKVLNDIAFKINTAYLEGDGFFINMTLPNDIFGTDYTIEINSNEVLMEVSNVSYTKILLTNNITGEPKKGLNFIENRRGEIILT